MNPPPAQLRAIFDAALDRAAGPERDAFVVEACQGDEVLLARIKALLLAHVDAGSFLADSTASPSEATDPKDEDAEESDAPPTRAPSTEEMKMPRVTFDDRVTEGPGTRIGPYKLLQAIGEGGMGTVFMAEQDKPIRRRVALKVIKAGMDTSQVVARFEAERQALAIMDHANIAKVLDAGATDAGRPYFVMELVKGIPITQYCDQARLTPKERLELFIPVCQAIQHAHQKGIIHRDIKPSNVLVTLIDGQAVPKVIDFGVAKATEQRLTEQTLFTQFGAIVGTPEYMSPEQAEISAMDVDTRSDVYSLGVLLYELLTGSTPLDRETLRRAGFAEMLKRIREEEPPTPSTRLSGSQDRLTGLSAVRNVEPARLARLVRGDLDWIVMKALAKERNRRYDSATGLADDIGRFLRDEPVSAGPPTASYRLGKFVRRNRGPVTAAILMLLTLAGGIAGTTIGLLRARAEKDRADLKATEAMNHATEANQERNRADAKTEEVRRNLYDSHMNLVQSAWEGGELGRVQELLRQCEPGPGEDDLRGFEWNYWNRRVHAYLKKFDGHDDLIISVEFSPDGNRLVSASMDGTVKVWNVENGQQMLSFHLVRGPISSMNSWAEFSPDGKTLVSEEENGILTIRDAANGWPSLSLIDFHGRNQISNVAFSPDSKRLASADDGGKVKVWDATTGREVLTLTHHSNPYPYSPLRATLSFSSDGKRLALASLRREIEVWDATTGQVMNPLLNGNDWPETMVISPDWKRLASFDDYGIVKVWDTSTGQLALAMKGHTSRVLKLKFSSDGKRLASVGDDGTINVWDATSLTERLILRCHTNSIVSVAFGPDCKKLASASIDGIIRIWDLTADRQTFSLEGDDEDEFSRLTFSADGTRLASARSDSTIRIWDVTTGIRTLYLRGHSGRVTSVAFSPDGKRLASASVDRTVKVWDVTTGQQTLSLNEHNGPVKSVAFSPDGKRLASVGGDALLRIWDAATGERRLSMKVHTGSVEGVFFSADWKQLASAGSDGVLNVWDLTTSRQTLSLLAHSYPIGSVTFSPDGKRLASAGYKPGIFRRNSPGEGAVKVWDATSGQQTLSINVLTDYVVFSPDGKRLATAGSEGVVRVWDTSTGHQTFSSKAYLSSVMTVAFRPDGQQLAAVGIPGTIKVWDARPWTSELRDESEALSLIHSLRNMDKVKPDWPDAIASNPTLSETVRRRALRFVREWPEEHRIELNLPDMAEPVFGLTPAEASILLRDAALMAWFGQDKQFAATCERAIGIAKDTKLTSTADVTAKLCSIRPSNDKARIEAALALARKAVDLGKHDSFLPYCQMVLGMAEYRSGHYSAALEALNLAAETKKYPYVPSTSAFYRAMSLFQQGKEPEARKLATDAIAKMKPLPADEKNPLAGDANIDDLILWLAYKEAKALLKLEAKDTK